VLPRGDGAGEAFELGDLAVGAVDVEVVEPPTRDAWVAGSVEVAESFFGDERVGDFTVGVTRGEAGHEPVEAALTEPPIGAKQQPSDAIQRVAFAASVPAGVVLHTTADVIERAVREADRVEVIDHDRRVREVVGVATERIERPGVDLCEPSARPLGEPAVDNCAAATWATSNRRARSMSTNPVMYSVWCRALARKNVVSSSPIDLTPSRRAGSSTSGVPCSTTAAIAVCQPTPNTRATPARSSLADPQADLRPCALREHRTRRYLAMGRRPGPPVAVRVAAAPQALGPHQHHRPTRDRQIPDLHSPPALPDCPAPAPATPDDIGRRLHLEVPLTVHHTLSHDRHGGDADKRGRSFAAALHRQGPPDLQSWSNRRIARPLAAQVDPLQETAHNTPPRFNAKSRSWLAGASPPIMSRPLSPFDYDAHDQENRDVDDAGPCGQTAAPFGNET
jgi:hypothetical protein